MEAKKKKARKDKEEAGPVCLFISLLLKGFYTKADLQ